MQSYKISYIISRFIFDFCLFNSILKIVLKRELVFKYQLQSYKISYIISRFIFDFCLFNSILKIVLKREKEIQISIIHCNIYFYCTLHSCLFYTAIMSLGQSMHCHILAYATNRQSNASPAAQPRMPIFT